jgi:hypothetical protein
VALFRSAAASTAANDELPAKWGQRSFWSDLTFGWASPVLALGQRRTLEAKDVEGIPVGEPAQLLCEDFERNLKYAVQKQAQPSLHSSSTEGKISRNEKTSRNGDDKEVGLSSVPNTATKKKFDDASMGKAVVAALLARHWKALAGTGVLRLTNTLLQVPYKFF